MQSNSRQDKHDAYEDSEDEDFYASMPPECRDLFQSLDSVEIPPMERSPAFYFLEAWELYMDLDIPGTPSSQGRAVAALLQIALAAAQGAYQIDSGQAEDAREAMRGAMRTIVAMVQSGMQVQKEMKRENIASEATAACTSTAPPSTAPPSTASASTASASTASTSTASTSTASTALASTSTASTALAANSRASNSLASIALTSNTIPSTARASACALTTITTTARVSPNLVSPALTSLPATVTLSTSRTTSPPLAKRARTTSESAPDVKNSRASSGPSTKHGTTPAPKVSTRNRYGSELPVFRTPGFGVRQPSGSSGRRDEWSIRIAPEAENIPGPCTSSRYRARTLSATPAKHI
ncbi:hypothetical protein OH76DRAFT_1488787 [Lentinus brumalis]|uniref:Uncharacterized protein n=1 Tax=Lentinus brumalis TaxID=2498619 RepID=A0A371CPR4_9APHY|nr:hypothetical protein OH76DRAFT_1488787 [Polyporus brumalis]